MEVRREPAKGAGFLRQMLGQGVGQSKAVVGGCAAALNVGETPAAEQGGGRARTSSSTSSKELDVATLTMWAMSAISAMKVDTPRAARMRQTPARTHARTTREDLPWQSPAPTRHSTASHSEISAASQGTKLPIWARI